jgi:hypothetical protein
MKSASLAHLLVLGFASAMAVGCASTPEKKASDMQYEADRVIGRSDNRSDRPSWATETVSVKSDGSKIQFIGIAEVPADSRTQAAFKMSDSNARGAVAAKVETNITRLVENSESGLNMEDQSLKSLVHELSQVSLRNVDIKDRYWEKVQRTASNGGVSAVMKAFSLIEMEKAQIEKLILEKEKASKAPEDLKNKVEQIVRSQWSSTEISN